MIRAFIDALVSVIVVTAIFVGCLALDKPRPSEKIALRVVGGAR